MNETELPPEIGGSRPDKPQLKDLATDLAEGGNIDPFELAKAATDCLGKFNPWFYVISWVLVQIATIVSIATSGGDQAVIIMGICSILVTLWLEYICLSTVVTYYPINGKHYMCCLCLCPVSVEEFKQESCGCNNSDTLLCSLKMIDFFNWVCLLV